MGPNGAGQKDRRIMADRTRTLLWLGSWPRADQDYALSVTARFFISSVMVEAFVAHRLITSIGLQSGLWPRKDWVVGTLGAGIAAEHRRRRALTARRL